MSRKQIEQLVSSNNWEPPPSDDIFDAIRQLINTHSKSIGAKAYRRTTVLCGGCFQELCALQNLNNPLEIIVDSCDRCDTNA